MKPIRLSLIAALSPALALSAFCQTPPPAPPAANVSAPQPPRPALPSRNGVATSHSGRVSSIIYGPQGEVQGLTLRNGIAVTLPPELAMRLQSNVNRGTRVQVSGIQRMIAGQASLVAQSITANGQTFVAAAPVVDRVPGAPITGPAIAAGAPPPPPPGPAGPLAPRRAAGRGPGAPPPPAGAAEQPPPPPRNAGPPAPPPPMQTSGIPAPPPGPTTADTPAPPPPDPSAPQAPSAGAPAAPPQM